MYIVIQEAIYRHKIKGLYSDEDTAIARAKHFKRVRDLGVETGDYDGHHKYNVYEVNPNQPIDDLTKHELCFSCR